MARQPKKLKPPIWLDEIATEEWKRVEKILREEDKDFTQKDIKALEAYCMNYSKWKKSELFLLENGNTVTCDSGYEQQRPEVSISFKAQQELRSWAKELGLTPAARQRMIKNQFIQEPQDEDEKAMNELIS